MKILASCLIVAAGFLCACSTPSRQTGESARLPLLRVEEDERLLAKFDAAPVESQPWMKVHRQAPVSLADLGLQGHVRLISYGLYLDGGSRKCVLGDGAGQFFAFCTSNPRDPEAAFLLGGTHFTQSNLVRVAEGTPSYRFLFDLLWSLVDDPRYQYSSESLEGTRKSMGMSKEDFDSLPEEAQPAASANVRAAPRRYTSVTLGKI